MLRGIPYGSFISTGTKVPKKAGVARNIEKTVVPLTKIGPRSRSRRLEAGNLESGAPGGGHDLDTRAFQATSCVQRAGQPSE